MMKTETLICTLIFVLSFCFSQSHAQDCNGGTVETVDGSTRVYTCPGDGIADVVNYQTTSTAATSYAYAITNSDNVILVINPGTSQDFDGAPPGTCRIWGFSYTGNILAQAGESVFSTFFSDGCWAISSNAIDVIRSVPDGGRVFMPSGETQTTLCTQDGYSDPVIFRHETSSNAAYRYVITDDQNNILGLPNTDNNDFEGVPSGVCRVWGLSYTGNITAGLGQNAASTALSDGCFELSENFIEVIRTDVDGGTVATDAGETEVSTTPGDGIDDIFTFTHTTNSSSNYRYVITDENNKVLGLPGNSQNFEGAGVGICLVWGISYTGELTIFPGDDLLDKALSTDCFDLSSNVIRVVRGMGDVEGGTVAMPSGMNKTYTCTQDGNADVVNFVSTGASGGNFIYVITSPTLEILGIEPNDFHDFDGAPPGTCWVWGLSYTGNLTAQVGDNAGSVALSDGNFDLSDNFIEVVRDQVEGGSITTKSGASSQNTCTQNGTPDVVEFAASGFSNSKIAYIITSPTLEILGIEMNDFHDFDGAPPGTCWVWTLAYTGNLTAQVGDNAGQVALSDDCFDLSDNFIEVVRSASPEGGSVAMPSGMNQTFTCTQDGNADVVNFVSTGASGENFIYVITSPTLEILGIEPNDFHDFDGAPPGTCWVWGLSYSGNLTAQVGDNAGEVALADGCFDLSDNFIEVVRSASPEGGSVAMPSGLNKTYTCTQDGNADVVNFVSTGASGGNFIYVITSPTLEILGIEPNDFHDFDGAPPGTCWVWGLSYTGNLTAQVGDNAGEVALADDCFDLSDNFIEVVRDEVEGGSITTKSGASSQNTCTQNGTPDVVEFAASGFSNSKIAYIITSPTLEILGIEMNDFHDFDGAPPGTCWVWTLAYTGNLTAQVGDNAGQVALSDDCFDLSDNFIEVVRSASPEGGTVAMPSGMNKTYTCTQDGTPDVVEFVSSGSSEGNFIYVITSPTLEILGLEPNDSHDFDGAPPGTCWVWGLSYTGNLTAQIGDNAGEVALADGCFDLSDNFIEVVRDEVNGGTVAMPSGLTTRYTCTQDDRGDVVNFVASGASNSKYIYIITSPSLEILGIEMNDFHDFNDAPPGTCWVWGLAYTGNLTAQVGDNAGEVALADDCFDLSDNFIEVIRDQVNGGLVSTPDGANFVYTCPQDGTPDVVQFSKSGASNSKYQFVITDNNNNILALPDADMNDFDVAPPGTCRVWGFAYTGDITAQTGESVFTTQFSTDCWAISANAIDIVRDVPDGGSVSTTAGATQVNVTVGDGIDDTVVFAHTNNSNSRYRYVITDDNNIILGLPDGNSANFEGAGVGVCRVWGLAYTGMLTATLGDNAAEVSLTDDCFDLSDNFIEIIRTAPGAPALNQKPISNSELSVQLYPNPVVQTLELNFGRTLTENQNHWVRIISVNGQIVLERALDYSSVQQLDVSRLETGLYLLQYNDGLRTLEKRFVKQ